MKIFPHTLALITTDRCTAACDDCCFECTPQKNTYIPHNKMIEVINDAKKIKSIKNIVFTGGECFTLGNKLKELIFLATKNNFNTRVVTNGYWAKNDIYTSKVCSEIRKAGLNEVNFSTGHSHAKYVPVENIIRAAHFCTEEGMTVVINIENHVDEEKSEVSIRIKNDELIKSALKKGKLKLINNFWVKEDNKKNKVKIKNIMQGCQTIMNVLAITPSLSLVPCCGIRLEKIKDIHLGSLSNNRLHNLIESADDDLMKMMLNIYGPEYLINEAKKIDRSIDVPEYFVHPCEYCEYIYRESRIKNALIKYARKNEKEILTLFMAGFFGKAKGITNDYQEDHHSIPVKDI
ncbi:Radical SAM superfamily protein [Izhakiella capsodis]|uniref:Radical SAM superfamily protein n=1 Tax=Izhakiella capsodis TaxID=1367852 RepID=A0A1I5B942_9GAMM|nr:radical SAM protein [Izhakiella capsodis]SFN71197.1 Radical SAM superfamily protein [Izhakiella capsodis]